MSHKDAQQAFFRSNLKLRRAGYGHENAMFTENLIRIEHKVRQRTHKAVKLARRQLRQARPFFLALSRNMVARKRNKALATKNRRRQRGWKPATWRFVHGTCRQLHRVAKQVYATLDPRSRFIENLEEVIPMIYKNFNPVYRSFRRKQIFTGTTYKFRRIIKRLRSRRRLIPRRKKRRLKLKLLAKKWRLVFRSRKFKARLLWTRRRSKEKNMLRRRPLERRHLITLPMPKYKSGWKYEGEPAYRRNRMQLQPVLSGYSIQHARVAARARRAIRMRLKVYKQIFYRKVYTWTITRKRVQVKLSRRDRNDYLHYYLWNLGNITGLAREREWQALKSQVSLHHRHYRRLSKVVKFRYQEHIRTQKGKLLKITKPQLIIPARINWTKMKKSRKLLKRLNRPRRNQRNKWVVRIRKLRIRKSRRKKVTKLVYYKTNKSHRLTVIRPHRVVLRKWIRKTKRFRVKRKKAGYITKEGKKVKISLEQLRIPTLTFA